MLENSGLEAHALKQRLPALVLVGTGTCQEGIATLLPGTYRKHMPDFGSWLLRS